ncbi:sensor histidine kinase [Kitasatospora acidiphila]|uniref:histidine kinase n=2 Tax=Kitasatospora acidiphila TaxID=2567942 RepID=A0A540WF96_9ACTN|nr:sensor histidine kinase [Kitasatospora acidiphila]
MPRPPLLERVPFWAWSALLWCAAAALAVEIAVRQPAAFRGAGWLWTVLSCVMAAPLGFARRWPEPVLGVVLTASLVTVALGRSPWPLFLGITDLLLLHIAAITPLRLRTAALVLGALAVEVCGWRGATGTWLAPPHTAIPIASATVVSWAIGNSLRQRRQYAQSLRVQAVQGERLRIARELHDEVAHSIGVIAIQSGAARLAGDDPAEVDKALGVIEATSRQTLAGLRRMLGTLRHDEAGPATGLADLDRLAKTAAQSGVRVDVRWQGRRRALAPEVELSAFRIVQESVTNVVRHANTRRCWVSVDYGEAELAIEVLDDGRGGAPSGDGDGDGGGYGIAGMRERVELLAGRFSAEVRPEGGFRVSARLPV